MPFDPRLTRIQPCWKCKLEEGSSVCVFLLFFTYFVLWSLLLTAAFVCFLFFSFVCLTFLIWCVCVLLPVSIAPPPPPMPQLTPQIPLTGFVARVQENSKFGQAELLKGRAYFLLACMAGKSDSYFVSFSRS